MNTTKLNIASLKTILSNTYLIYTKTQNYHWNVTGVYFKPLHELFESQYQELAEKIDEIAERIRMLGAVAPGAMSEFLRHTTLSESLDKLSWQEMLTSLISDHESQNNLLQESAVLMSDAGDEVSAGLMADLQTMHQMMLWVLKSHLE